MWGWATLMFRICWLRYSFCTCRFNDGEFLIPSHPRDDEQGHRRSEAPYSYWLVPWDHHKHRLRIHGHCHPRHSGPNLISTLQEAKKILTGKEVNKLTWFHLGRAYWCWCEKNKRNPWAKSYLDFRDHLKKFPLPRSRMESCSSSWTCGWTRTDQNSWWPCQVVGKLNFIAN